jgi:hypothetical protein
VLTSRVRRVVATIVGLAFAAGLTVGSGLLLGGEMPVVLEAPEPVTRTVTRQVIVPRFVRAPDRAEDPA